MHALRVIIAAWLFFNAAMLTIFVVVGLVYDFTQWRRSKR